MRIGLIDILKLGGFDHSLSTRLVRHQSRSFPIDTLLSTPGLFELYQSYQSKPVFHNVSQIVSFYGMTGTRAGFHGVYKVRGHRPASDGSLPPSGDRSEVTGETARFFYELVLDDRFTELNRRLVIEWGPSTRMWRQRLTNKEILEVLAPGRSLPLFKDYLEFSLSLDQLQKLVASDGSAHRDWRSSLASVAGIYLIADEGTGSLCVGSACGADGIWGRWKQYSESGHGGNSLLIQLLERFPERKSSLRFSLLQTLPKSMTQREVIQREVLYKQKLGKRAVSLNGN